MKKTLLVMLALVMTLATITTAVSFVSAEDKTDAPEKYIVATLNPVTVDGVNTKTPGVPHVQAPDKSIQEFGKTITNEFVLDNKLEHAYIGAAWDLEKKEIYFAFSTEGLATAEIIIGGESFEVNFTKGEVEGGKVVVNEAGNFAEVALPIDFTLKENATHVYADLEINITAAEDSSFEGAVLFDKHAAGYCYNKPQKDGNAMIHAKKAGVNGQSSVISETRFLRVLDDEQAAAGAMRTYALLTPGANATKNISFEFDLQIDAMPKATPNPAEGPESWTKTPEARIWGAFMWIKGDILYYNFYNTADQGIVFALYRQTAGFVSEKEMVVIPTGKQVGDLFTFTMEWNEENTVRIYIDHVLAKEVENGGCANAALGTGYGCIQFNAQRKGAMGVGETIDAMYGNVSVNEVLYDYDEAALKALSDTPFETTTESETTSESETTTVATSETTTVTTSETTTVTTSETTTAETTTTGTNAVTTKAPATTTEAEKGGCGSSLVAYGAVMVVGSALMAVVATSKKKED